MEKHFEFAMHLNRGKNEPCFYLKCGIVFRFWRVNYVHF